MRWEVKAALKPSGSVSVCSGFQVGGQNDCNGTCIHLLEDRVANLERL